MTNNIQRKGAELVAKRGRKRPIVGLGLSVTTGDKMPSFGGVPLDRLFVYAYAGGGWQQIPWQFDEVISGHITVTEDALLEADDQLVFMVSDTGDQAPAGSWIDNADSQQYPPCSS